MVRALIDEQAVVRADHQIVEIVQRPRTDADRGEIAHRAHGRLADPAHFLRAVVAGQHAVAHGQILDRDLRAGRQRDVGATGKAGTGHFGKFLGGLFGVDAHQRIIGARRQVGQGQQVNLRDIPGAVGFDNHDGIGGLPVG